MLQKMCDVNTSLLKNSGFQIIPKIDEGKMKLEHLPFILRESIESTLDMVATRAAEKGLDLTYTIDERIAPTILGDWVRLRQVLANLLSNAVKFTEKGSIGINIQPGRCFYLQKVWWYGPGPGHKQEAGTADGRQDLGAKQARRELIERRFDAAILDLDLPGAEELRSALLCLKDSSSEGIIPAKTAY